MSLYRYLPTPSDRMGITWTLLTVKDAIVLEYGPAGTTHFSVGTLGKLGLDSGQKIFTTHLSEDDVIMGDVTRLEDAILEIDENFHPKVIFVVSSAVVSVIGTDLKGVCHYMQEQVGAQLVPVDTGGFKGDYSIGLKNGWTLLTEKFCGKTEEEKKNCYNILGASPYNYRIKSDLNEIRRLITEGLSMECNLVLGCDSTLEQFECAGDVSVNLVLQEEALPAVEYLKKQFGTPYVYGVPYGYTGTKKWLERVAKEAGKDITESVQKELGTKIREAMPLRMYPSMFMGSKTKPKAVIVGEYDTVCGIAGAMEEIAMPVTVKLCNHSIAGLPENGVVRPMSEKERIDLLKPVQKSLVFGDLQSLFLCGDDCVKVMVSAPFKTGTQRATHLPFMGIRGMDYLLEQVDEYYGTL